MGKKKSGSNGATAENKLDNKTSSSSDAGKKSKSSKKNEELIKEENKNIQPKASTSTEQPNSPAQPDSDQTVFFSQSSRDSESLQAEKEISKLRNDINQLNSAKLRSDEILSAVADQDWDTAVEKLTKIKAAVNEELSELSSDLQALRDFARQQRDKALKESASGLIQEIRRDDGGRAFTYRDSKLSVMFRTTQEFRTVYHIFVAALILFTIKLVTNNLLVPGSREMELSLVIWNFTGVFTRVIPVSLAMIAMHLVIVPIMWGWRRNMYSTRVYTLLYFLLQAVFVTTFGYVSLNLQLPIASAMIVACEQTRFFMKMHSFYRESIKIRNKEKISENGIGAIKAVDDKRNYVLLNSFSEQLYQYIYFSFVPTLIYRNWYPRTRRIRWSFVLARICEISGCIFFTAIIFSNFCLPEIKKAAVKPGDWRALVLALSNSFLPSIVLFLLAFFGLLHSWMNLWGELLRFADRLFYQDWWNSRDFATYYRKWNMVVHDWLYNYLYLDSRDLFGFSTAGSMWYTFAISAIVHEYIITLAIGFFYPLLFVLFLGAGVFFVYLTKLFKGHHYWNIFFWTNMMIGDGMLTAGYVSEYYAKMYANTPVGVSPGYGFEPVNFQYSHDSLLPYSWQPFFTNSTTGYY